MSLYRKRTRLIPPVHQLNRDITQIAAHVLKNGNLTSGSAPPYRRHIIILCQIDGKGHYNSRPLTTAAAGNFSRRKDRPRRLWVSVSSPISALHPHPHPHPHLHLHPSSISISISIPISIPNPHLHRGCCYYYTGGRVRTVETAAALRQVGRGG